MDDTTPATKGDLLRLESTMMQRMDERFTEMDERFTEMNGRFHVLSKEMDERFSHVNEGIDRVLDVVVNIDQRMKEQLADHEKRITRLEKAVA